MIKKNPQESLDKKLTSAIVRNGVAFAGKSVSRRTKRSMNSAAGKKLGMGGEGKIFGLGLIDEEA